MEPITLLIVVAGVIAVGVSWSRGGSKRPVVAPDKPELAYSIFTTEFDTTCHATELEEILAAAGVDRRAAKDVGEPNLQVRYEAALKASSMSSLPLEGLKELESLTDVAILFFVDQSGSMTPKMPTIFGGLLAGAQELERRGATVAIAGFTTVGWRGGRARQKWLQSGTSEYPGRLCDLLHVVHKDFNETVALEGHPLLGIDVCFENVDGESIEWAEQFLAIRSESTKLLVAVSDGAPVDDSTLQANGERFLWRDLKDRVSSIEKRENCLLAAIGFDERVKEVYENSIVIDVVDSIGSSSVAMCERLLRPAMAGVAKKP